MSLFICSLNSGSNGNCYYVGNQKEAILVDAGISCRETERRMARSGLSMTKVKAIFISHEHTDHTYGAPVLSRKYRIPVYIAEAAHANSKLILDRSLKRVLAADDRIEIGGLSIKAFSKQHDAADPLSFTVSHEKVVVGVFTDIGSVCSNLIQHFQLCDAAFLESNYDENMLIQGSYPWFLKNRIRGDQGHLSNDQALELFKTHRSPALSHLFLAHLSKDNNNATRVMDLFHQETHDVRIAVASRFEESPVLTIGE